MIDLSPTLPPRARRGPAHGTRRASSAPSSPRSGSSPRRTS